MPARPFPFPLSIGTDICRTARIHKLISRPAVEGQKQSPLLHFMNRFLTFREQNDFWKKFGTIPNVADKKFDAITMHLAGRWAAKEAVIKAVGYRQVKLMDVEILRSRGPNGVGGVFALIRDTPGSPTPTEESRSAPTAVAMESTGTIRKVKINPRMQDEPFHSEKEESLEEAYGELEGQIAKVSISHDTGYATAVCLAADQPMEGDVGGEAAARMP
ncbi:hypothetical protein M409DRAFT_58644 [Zasmidium cellare ATCC 36951]|uniref:4'-phosphopantetheinyl transferase domain-containing protein n=1 Tax=Zasmidium cellare ATCC 36951 TaxID=1080233 RepID=A0A6A6C7I5_ZASCE|nr:uncharacterized protein M409DRAFT_58644 [Zasmidium cellare ATCC 36951]KAF2161862.1 hypothetical protein M409DRAFT_58644 [Zasmidium cellare ATCC 36951]